MNIAIFAAHPDDEVLGCGATAARLSQEGHTVIPVIICENATVRYEDQAQAILEKSAVASSEILGMAPPVFLRLPDQKLDTFAALEMAQAIEKTLHEYEPSVVFTHHGGDINMDHRVVFEATMVATRPVPGQEVRTVYTYETISSTEWGAPGYHANFAPNTFYDVTSTLELKLKAFSQYELEVREYPHPRSLEALEIRAKDWGARVGMRAAEAFHLVRNLT